MAGSERGDGWAPAGVCPLLRSADGGWTSVHASRELRCWAAEPPIAPAVAKQRSLCVSARHVVCATYEAAVPGGGVVRGGGSLLWPAASSVPVALEPAAGRGASMGSVRSAGQVALVALMVVAFGVLLLSRTPQLATAPGTSMLPVASASMVGGGSASAPTPDPVSPTPASASPSASASPTQPTASSSPSASPAGSPRTYTVRSGDTLAVIAGRYHTTVKAIVAANSITDPRTIHPGQVLVIP